MFFYVKGLAICVAEGPKERLEKDHPTVRLIADIKGRRRVKLEIVVEKRYR